ATAYGTYVTLLIGLGFFGPMLAGALSDAFGLQLALVYMQLVFVIGGLIMLVAGFTYVKDYNRARAMEA
ncbi:MAG: MFS transporter, partial [Bilophila wadsworthia]